MSSQMSFQRCQSRGAATASTVVPWVRVVPSVWILFPLLLVAATPCHTAFLPSCVVPTRDLDCTHIARQFSSPTRSVKHPYPRHLLSSILPEQLNGDEPSSSLTSNSQEDDGSTIPNDDTSQKAMAMYRNRSFILERTLQQKLQHLHLSQQKLLVLQDAAHRVAQRHQAAAVTAARHHDDVLSDTKQQLQVSTLEEQRQKLVVLEYTSQMQSLERQRDELQEQTESLSTTCRELTTDRDEVRRQLETVQAQANRDAKVYAVDRRIWQEQMSEQQERHAEVLESVYSDHDDAQRTVQANLVEVQTQRDALQLQYDKEHRLNRLYRVHIRKLQDSNKGLILKQQELQEQQQQDSLVADQSETSNNAVSTDELEEQMEIAQAAVAASQLREARLQEQYEELQQRFAAVEQEKLELQEQLDNVERQGVNGDSGRYDEDGMSSPDPDRRLDVHDILSIHEFAFGSSSAAPVSSRAKYEGTDDGQKAALGFEWKSSESDIVVPPTEGELADSENIDIADSIESKEMSEATVGMLDLEVTTSAYGVAATVDRQSPSTWASLLEREPPETDRNDRSPLVGIESPKASPLFDLRSDATGTDVISTLGQCRVPPATESSPETTPSAGREASIPPKSLLVPVELRDHDQMDSGVVVASKTPIALRAYLRQVKDKLVSLMTQLRQSQAWMVADQRLQPVRHRGMALWRRQQQWTATSARYMRGHSMRLWAAYGQPLVNRIPFQIVRRSTGDKMLDNRYNDSDDQHRNESAL